MKHYVKNALLCGAAFVSVLSVSGCNSALPFTKNAVDLNKTYTASADINCGNVEAKAEITRLGGGEWEFSFSEPKSLAGMTLSLNENGYTASLGGLSFSAENNEGYSTAADIIASTADGLAENNDGGSSQDGVITFSTEYNGKTVTMNVSEETGDIISLKCPYYKLAVYFSDQTECAPESTEECGLVEE